MSLETIVIATGNKKKLKEIKELLVEFPLEIKSLSEVGLEGLEIIEDGNTFEDNALIKARTVMKKTGFASIADDSGLEVDALEGKPGIYSARFAGEDANDNENNTKLLRLLEDVPEEKRTARFVCAIAVVFPNEESIVTRGTCEGVIGSNLQGQRGFGYDPLFIVPQLDKTFAEIDGEYKNKISHRGSALNKLRELMEGYFKES